jgi:hypothetical protein
MFWCVDDPDCEPYPTKGLWVICAAIAIASLPMMLGFALPLMDWYGHCGSALASGVQF